MTTKTTKTATVNTNVRTATKVKPSSLRTTTTVMKKKPSSKKTQASHASTLKVTKSATKQVVSKKTALDELQFVEGLKNYMEFLIKDHINDQRGKFDDFFAMAQHRRDDKAVVELAEKIEKFAQEQAVAYTDGLKYEYNRKFIRVMRGNKMHSFICIDDSGKFARGDILKPTVYHWQANKYNNASGNILTGDFSKITHERAF